jgi:hypothetical protein
MVILELPHGQLRCELSMIGLQSGKNKQPKTLGYFENITGLGTT